MHLLPVNFLQKVHFILLFCLLGFPWSMIYSQANEYFPLEIGNTWTYDDIVDGEVKRQPTITIIDTVKLENKIYYLFDRYFYCRALKDSQLFRIDSTKVYRYVNNHEQMFLDFSANVDDSWNVDVYDPNLDTLTTVKVVLQSKTWNHVVNGREFENCYSFVFDNYAYATDMSWEIIVAPDVGCIILFIATLVPREFWFRSGMINQIEYPDLVNSIEPHETFESAKNSVWAYPNPFNARTIIRYKLAVASDVDLSIYNILGQKIATIVSGKMSAGYHEVEFNGQNLSSGVYLYRIEAGEWSDVKKMLLVK